MVGLQNKVKLPPNVQHVSEPDGMIDIDLKTTIDNVIEINKKKLYKRRSCYKKLLFAIPIGILVTTSALLLIRTYLSSTLNKKYSTEHETLPTLEYSEINFDKEENLNLNMNMNDKNKFIVKRDIKRYNPDDAFIPSQSTSTNFNLTEMHTSSTPGFLYYLNLYKGNKITVVPNNLSSNDDRNLAKTMTPSLQEFGTNQSKESNFDSESTTSLTASKSPNFDTNELISSTEKIDLDQLTTDTLESVTLPNFESITEFFTSTFDTIDSHADDLKIENSTTTIPDQNKSTIIDFSTEATSDNTISQFSTPKSDQTELNKINKDEIQVKATSLNENHLVEQNDLYKLIQDKKNLTQAVLPSSPNTYFKQSKVTEVTETIPNVDNIDLVRNLNVKMDRYFTEADSTTFYENPSSEFSTNTEEPDLDQFTTDALKEVTFADSEIFTQFSAIKSDNIGMHSKDLKLETSSYLPDENESTVSIGVIKNLSENLKYKLPIPFNREFHHSSQKPEIPTTLFNGTDLSKPIADISLIDKTSHLDEGASTQFSTPISDQTDSYGINNPQENLNSKTEIFEITTKFLNDIEANKTVDVDSKKVNKINLKTDSSTKSTLPSFNILKTKSTFQTESTVDLINQSTATNAENLTLPTNAIHQTIKFEDKNDSPSSNHNTTRNLELSQRISKNSDDVLEMNRRASTTNQQVFSSNSNQFQLTPINNWQPQEFQNFEVDKSKAKESISPGLQIPTNQQNLISNQNYPLTVCPSGVKILQQSNGNPYYYNYPSSYQNILPLSSAAYNPYMNPLIPYQGGGNVPQFYNNQPLQLGGYQPNNFYRDNSLSNGQYYICSTLSSNPYIQTAPEIRKRNEFILQKTNSIADVKNGTRAAGECPFGEYRCNDGSKCIKRNQYCDNAVHCNDMSDELQCSCISRIEKSRMCDGYLDCPDGEDESKCFGCDEDAFNCDDWTPQDRFSTCIPLEQRCDGVVNCPNRKDEEKCSVLTEYFSTEQNFLVTYAKGYLYRNFGGKWFPVCRNPEMWANDACQLDGGGSYMSPLTHLIQTNINYRGPYVSMSPRGQLNFDNTCSTNSAVFVECPLLVCGTRIKTRNYYRSEEVDISAERILTQSLNFDQNEKNVTDSDEDAILGNSRVVGGKPSQPESWPWIVSIYRNGVFHCGGVLINEFWIVTAAHCVDKYWHYYFEVQAGLLRRYSYSPIVQTRVASHIISHQSYDKLKLKNDIALINLDNPVRYNRYVRPICLPSEITAGQNFMRNPQPNTICSAIGWGATSEHGSDPDHLREVDVPVLKNCKYKEDREGHEICAGLREGGKDACQGDSGGPFLCRNPNVENQWYLAGIVSHGEGCARPNEPGVYTRVSMYLQWIHDNIRSNVQQRQQPLNHCPGYTCKDTKRCIPKQRHCDKIIDCLYADDEIDCDRSHFTEIFKHAIIDNLLPRANEDKSLHTKDLIWDEDQNEHDNKDDPDYILRQTESSDISSELFETIAVNNSFIENVNENNVKSPFLCQKMLQTIDITKRCDKVPDCEDATDEENCTCVDYLKYSHPEAVCDGAIDCFDASDEQNCPPKCRSNEFYCYLSNVCIQNYKQCDGKRQCPSGEDERNCFALTALKDVTLGVDFRPEYMSDGFVSFYHNGTWEIVCGNWNTTEAAQYATQICIYLGFHDYKTFYKILVPNKSLMVKQNKKVYASTEPSVPNNKCTGIKVDCSDTIDVTHEADVVLKQSFDNFEFIPWNAEIYMNGKYICSGALLEKNWVVTTKTCFGSNYMLHSNYVAVLLGGRSKMYLNVNNVYEQVIRVVEYLAVNFTDISLLRLEREAIVSNYIRPLGLDVRQYSSKEKELCVVVGRNASNQTELIYLKSRDICTYGFRCFMKDNEFNSSSCKNKSNLFWGGCVVCRSKRGWYLASVFFNHFGSCLTGDEMWSSIQYWKFNMLKLMEQTPFTVAPTPCNGFRCNLGECIKNYQVCDGIPHCRDGKDEEKNYCADKVKTCSETQSCECKPSELKCKNGKCVEKFRFCDRVNDCGDWSDEPVKCDCRSYLEVTNPEKLCDSVRNCRDQTDEDPFVCKCSEDKFRCQQSNLCVSKEVVCDQTSDCPNGEDESYCIELVDSEVQVRTAGLWHPGCFREHLTTLQLEDICEHVGFVGSSALRNNTVKKTSGRPVMDPFIGIVVNRIDDQPLIIAKRDGDKPYITFKEDINCYRLFLNCL